MLGAGDGAEADDADPTAAEEVERLLLRQHDLVHRERHAVVFLAQDHGHHTFAHRHNLQALHPLLIGSQTTVLPGAFSQPFHVAHWW